MSEDLKEQLMNAFHKQEFHTLEHAVGQIECVRDLVPRALALLELAEELRKRSIPLGRRLSWWYKLWHYPCRYASPDYEFQSKGRYGIGFSEYWTTSPLTLESKACKDDYWTGVVVYPDRKIIIYGAEHGIIRIEKDNTVRESLVRSGSEAVRVLRAAATIDAIDRMLTQFDAFEQAFKRYITAVTKQVEAHAEDV